MGAGVLVAAGSCRKVQRPRRFEDCRSFPEKNPPKLGLPRKRVKPSEETPRAGRSCRPPSDPVSSESSPLRLPALPAGPRLGYQEQGLSGWCWGFRAAGAMELDGAGRGSAVSPHPPHFPASCCRTDTPGAGGGAAGEEARGGPLPVTQPQAAAQGADLPPRTPKRKLCS